MFLEFLTIEWANNTVEDYALAVLIFLASFAALKIIKSVVVKKIKALADHTKTEVDDILVEIVGSIALPFYIFLPLYIGCRFIHLPVVIEKAIFYILIVVVIYYAIRAIQTGIDYGFRRVAQRKKESNGDFDPSAINLLSKISKVILWLVAILIILQNLGYNISTLVAGLGVGGVAIAFAMQNILSDMFSSFSIYFDKPFQVGDFIIVGDDMGTVKKIGIKSTRIQTLQGQELVMSNKELTEARIHNYKRMERRRVVLIFGVTYDTPVEKLKRIPRIIKEILDEPKLAEFDRAHFKSFGDSSLIFEVVYYVNASDYTAYMDIQQDMNLAIKERFQEEGISMAYPTQTVYVHKIS